MESEMEPGSVPWVIPGPVPGVVPRTVPGIAPETVTEHKRIPQGIVYDIDFICYYDNAFRGFFFPDILRSHSLEVILGI